ncbi:MAG: response regulator, partial [Candidatus Riflebacteria bacterium]|nr:response regulator [Candidatus Riflebacteria bacterium]
VDQLLQESIDASRSLTAELPPTVLYDAGLVPALRWLCRWMGDKHRLHVEVAVDGCGEPGSLEMKVLLFQAVRELLFNVVKHSGSSEARLEISLDDGRIVIAVVDRGRGFSPTASATCSGGGFGLFSVGERLELLGGRLSIQSSPGEGARVTLAVPLDPSGELSTNRETGNGAGPPAEQAGRAAAGRRIRVLLADDHSIVREGLAAMLELQPEIELIGQAVDGLAAVELACSLRPDVVVMDITMPKLNGIEATRRITAAVPGVRVVGLSMHQEEDVARCMKQAGAAAYLRKDGPVDALIEAIGVPRGPAVGSSRPAAAAPE